MNTDRVVLNPGYYLGYAGLVVWVIGTEISARVPVRYTVYEHIGGEVRAALNSNLTLTANERGLAVVRVFTAAQGPAWSFETVTPRLLQARDELILHVARGEI